MRNDSQPKETAKINIKWDEVYDFVVVGSGGGAMVAAITAHDKGLKTLVVEKAKYYGGSTAMSGGGFWIPNNHLAKKAGIADSAEEAFAYMKSITRGMVSEDRLKMYVEKAPEMVKYLEDNAQVKFSLTALCDYYPKETGARLGGRSLECPPLPAKKIPDAKSIRRQSPMRILFWKVYLPSVNVAPLAMNSSLIGQIRKVAAFAPVVLRRFPWLGRREEPYLYLGNALIGRLRASMANREIPLWLRSPMVDLIVENGRVVGLEVTKDGAPQLIKAEKGVLLAAGGFAHNQAMREKYLRKPTDSNWSVASPGDTGDTIIAAMKIGAAVGLMNQVWGMPCMIIPKVGPSPVMLEKAQPHGMFVNSKGRRFVSEADPYPTVVNAIYDKNSAEATTIPCWFVFDQAYRKRYMAGPLMPLASVPEEYITSGWIKVGKTIEELAEKCGIDPAGLADEVKKYNGFAKTGVDTDFHRGSDAYQTSYADAGHKPNPCLGEISRPPFYAIPVVPGDLGTKGGVNVDQYARVLREDGSPIKGLYAAGNNSSSVMGPIYAGGGATIGATMTFGYVAALHAAGQI